MPYFIGFIGIVFGLMVVKWLAGNNKKLFKILLWAYGLRLMALLVNTFLFTLPQGGSDAVIFERGAYNASRLGIEYIILNLDPGSHLLSYLFALVYLVTGRAPLLLGAIMITAGTIVVWAVYKIARELWGQKVAFRSGWITALFPTLILHSALILRETPVNLFLILACLFFVYWYRKKSTLYFPLGVVSILAAVAFHGGIFIGLVALLLPIFLYAVKSFFSGRLVVFARYMAVFIVSGFFVVIVNQSGWGIGALGGGLDSVMDRLEEREQRDTIGGAAFSEELRFRDEGDIFSKGPVRILYFMFSPFPWMVTNPAHIIGVFDAIIYIMIIIGLIKSWKYIKKVPVARMLVFLYLVLVITFAFGVSNFGTAIRHRAKMAPIAIALLVVLPWEKASKRKKPVIVYPTHGKAPKGRIPVYHH